MGSWSVLYSTQLRAKPMSASFFADGDTVYAETLGLPETSFRERQQVVIDLPNRKSTERMSSSLVGDPTMNYFALSQSHLVGVEYVRGQGQRALVLAALPDYRAVARTLRREEPPPRANQKSTGLFVSADRSVLVYLAGHSIVCRRTNDLGVIWTRQIEPEMAGVSFFSLTPDGGRIAAAVMDTMFIEDQKAYYIGVFAGKDGSPVARLHLNGFECLAISPDGKLLGVGQRIRLKSGEMQPTVNIHDIASGAQVATVIHDRLRVGRKDFGNDEINCQFTPDGKYLITSSIHTRVWSL
jgi:WD40 repeat protein